MAITNSIGSGILASPGVGSGLDVNSIVSQLMAVEQKPLTQLQTKDSKINAQISAYGTLSSSLSSFQTAMNNIGDLAKFQVNSATSSDNTVLTATASSTAAPGTHTVQVVRAAEQHKLSSTTSFAATDTIAASTTTTIGVGSASFTVDISGKTLSEVADAINGASDNAGVTATVAKVDTGYKLLLTANDTGSANALTATYSGADPFSMTTLNLARSGGPSFTASDLDAVMILDGSSSLTATRSSNTVTDLIGGVTLTLQNAGTVTVKVARDTAAVTKSIQSFVDAYNSLRGTLDTQSKGNLQGDSTLLSITSNILNVINTPPTGLTGSYTYMSQVGVSIQKDGTMTLDSAALNSALSSDYSGVANLFAKSGQGYASRLGTVANQLLTSNGLITSRTDGLKTTLASVKDSEANMQSRLDLIQQSYLSQFTALDTMLGSLKTTSSYLTQQLANLPGFR